MDFVVLEHGGEIEICTGRQSTSRPAATVAAATDLQVRSGKVTILLA